MACREWSRLLDSYSAALRIYSDAVMSAGGLEGAAFEQARERAEERKKAAHEVESLLDEHERQHGCTGKYFAAAG